MKDTLVLFKDMLVTERIMSHNTVMAYLSDVKDFIDWLADNQINANSIYEYFKTKRYTNSTMTRKIAAFSLWIQFCSTDLGLDLNLTIPKIKSYNRIPNILSNKDLNQILEYLDKNPSRFNIKMHAIIELLYNSGLRISELLSIRNKDWHKIYTTQQFSIIGKGNKERIVFVSKHAVNIIDKYLSNIEVKSEYLFRTQSGSAMNRQSIHRQLKIVARHAGIPPQKVFPHAFRHRLGSNLNQKGMNLAEIKEILGHKQIKTTMVYTHLEDEWIFDIVKANHPLGVT
jgi:integrase/recombinase XerD